MLGYGLWFLIFLFCFFCGGLWMCYRKATTTRRAKCQHLGAGIGMITYLSHSVLSQRDKLVCYDVATLNLRTVIFTLQEICTRTMLSHQPWLLFLAEGYVSQNFTHFLSIPFFIWKRKIIATHTASPRTIFYHSLILLSVFFAVKITHLTKLRSKVSPRIQ